jgi:hypothetical protein
MINKITKIGLSLVVAFCAAYPYLFPAEKSGALETVAGVGLWVGLFVVLLFFTAIYFYCKALQRCLELIEPVNRTATPKSVWYMFLIPYNIIEDFFIVINVSKSIENEARQNPKLIEMKDNGLIIGMGWCIAQVLSLIPNWGGQIAGGMGLILWIAHWLFIRRVNKHLLNEPSQPSN